MALLDVCGVSRFYEGGRVQALRDISFSAGNGEVVAITGPSGCGKSTLLSLVGLLDRPDSGVITIAGQNLSHVRKPAQFRARNIGFVFQFHHMVPTMTILENVSAPMIALGVPRAERRERAEFMLDQMSLSQRAGFLPSRVSGGERQRAAVARALINRPALILADEPTGNLDSANGNMVVKLLFEHARLNGALILLATHNPDISSSSDRCIELLDGRTIDGTPASALSSSVEVLTV